MQGPVDQSSSQSADAARAARMSRVGTKVGRELCGNSVECRIKWWSDEWIGRARKGRPID